MQFSIEIQFNLTKSSRNSHWKQISTQMSSVKRSNVYFGIVATTLRELERQMYENIVAKMIARSN